MFSVVIIMIVIIIMIIIIMSMVMTLNFEIIFYCFRGSTLVTSRVTRINYLLLMSWFGIFIFRASKN